MQNFLDIETYNQSYQPDGLRANLSICQKCPHIGRDWHLGWIPAQAHICTLPYGRATDLKQDKRGEILAIWYTGTLREKPQMPVLGYVPLECPFRLEHLYDNNKN